MVSRKKKKRKRGTRKSHRKGKPSGRAAELRRSTERRGFTPPGRKEVETMNIGRINLFLKEGRINAPKEDEKWIIRPDQLGIDKVLGTGRVDEPMKLVLPPKVGISQRARKKVQDAGGSIHELEKE